MPNFFKGLNTKKSKNNFTSFISPVSYFRLKQSFLYNSKIKKVKRDKLLEILNNEYKENKKAFYIKNGPQELVNQNVNLQESINEILVKVKCYAMDYKSFKRSYGLPASTLRDISQIKKQVSALEKLLKVKVSDIIENDSAENVKALSNKITQSIYSISNPNIINKVSETLNKLFQSSISLKEKIFAKKYKGIMGKIKLKGNNLTSAVEIMSEIDMANAAGYYAPKSHDKPVNRIYLRDGLNLDSFSTFGHELIHGALHEMSQKSRIKLYNCIKEIMKNSDIDLKKISLESSSLGYTINQVSIKNLKAMYYQDAQIPEESIARFFEVVMLINNPKIDSLIDRAFVSLIETGEIDGVKFSENMSKEICKYANSRKPAKSTMIKFLEGNEVELESTTNNPYITNYSANFKLNTSPQRKILPNLKSTSFNKDSAFISR